MLDANERPGGSWQHLWPSMRLFSPPSFSSLPGWMMPAADRDYPPATHVVDYLARYGRRYELPVLRGRPVTSVTRVDDDPRGALLVSTGAAGDSRGVMARADGRLRDRHVGTPLVPRYPGTESFAGRQRHSFDYRGPEPYAGRRVVLVGGGNTAAQLIAEISLVADTTWVTLRPPKFLPDDVDGRVLFDVATARRRALDAGERDPGGVAGLGDVVMIEAVRDARDRGVLEAEAMFERITRPASSGVTDPARTPIHPLVHLLGRTCPPRPAGAPPGGHTPGDHRHPCGRRAPPAPRRLWRLDRPRVGHPHRGGPHRARSRA